MSRVDDLLKEFKPQFGNMTHVAINVQIGKYRKLQEHIKKHDSRVKSLTRAINKKTQAEKDLERLESSLVGALEAEAKKNG